MIELAVTAADRLQGKTTALLDVALANARRGLTVEVWSPNSQASRSAFELATRLIPPGDTAVAIYRANGHHAIRYPVGRLYFVHPARPAARGVRRADMEVVDGPKHVGRITRNDDTDMAVRRG